MEKKLGIQHTLETTAENVIDKRIHETQINNEPKIEGLSISLKQKKKPCAGCDGICCTKSTKEKNDGHHHAH